jgi:hypothetical protein
MKFYLISYNPGMFGEFISDMIQNSGNNFYNKLTSTNWLHNRVLYPNYLSPIGRDLKTHVLPTFHLSDTELQILHGLYTDSNVCLSTHWYHSIDNTNLPCTGIRLYSNNINYINLAYCMSWIKSHATSTIWPDRRQEIENRINEDHQYSELFKSVLNSPNSKNWHYLAIEYKLLKDGKFDLDYFLKNRYTTYVPTSMLPQHTLPNWNYVDIGKLIHGDMSNIEDLESIIEGKLYKYLIRDYANRNLKLLKEKTGLTLESLSGSSWLNRLVDYCNSVNE